MAGQIAGGHPVEKAYTSEDPEAAGNALVGRF
ncbi:hypothetical protein F4560_007507 [Saccharothrix ecbatanensis]|uniref:Uncharacterized protein n=1 Tax=Saccharothrix ecbatanensis TaxID=1105145 RepID=A0A7W9HSP8_9PSEU|nr:hypothetical protein [Saccharothrix ecbatanensis]